MSWIYFLEFKSEMFDNFKKFKSFVERQSGCRLKTLQTNRGGELMSKELCFFCEDNGINRELIAPYTLEQNGVAERKNRTVVEMGRSMMEGRGVQNVLG